MMEFFSQYPVLKWILIGFGVLAFLSKYLKFDPIDTLINRAKRTYKFEEINHLNNPQLKQLIEDVNGERYDQVGKSLQQLNGSYRSFGLRALGQYANAEIIDSWITKDPDNVLPKIIKSYQLVFKGWEARGRQTIDTVSKKNLATYKMCLKQAEELLHGVQNDANYKINVHALLLKIYKAIDTDRETIHRTFHEVEKLGNNHAELNFNYFAAVSIKWGGTKQETDSYLSSLSNKSEFLNNLILAQYYFDYVHIMDGEDSDLEMKAFLDRMKSFSIDDNELYQYEFYLLLYWLANNLKYINLESYYKQMAAPYCKD